MHRRLFTLASALSLLLSLSAAAIWIRGHFVSDWIQHCFTSDQPTLSRTTILHIVSNTGEIGLSVSTYTIQGASPESDATRSQNATFRKVDFMRDHAMFERQQSRKQPLWSTSKPTRFEHFQPSFLQRLGFSFDSYTQQDPGVRTSAIDVRFPPWAIILPSSILPALWLLTRLRHRRRLRIGLCPTCSYDLRSSKDKCPECGSPIRTTQPPPAHSLPTITLRDCRWITLTFTAILALIALYHLLGVFFDYRHRVNTDNAMLSIGNLAQPLPLDRADAPFVFFDAAPSNGDMFRSGVLLAIWRDGTYVRATSQPNVGRSYIKAHLTPDQFAEVRRILRDSGILTTPESEPTLFDCPHENLTIRWGSYLRTWSTVAVRPAGQYAAPSDPRIAKIQQALLSLTPSDPTPDPATNWDRRPATWYD